MLAGLEQLLDVWEKLAERERKCVLTYAMRVMVGQRKFGPMEDGKYDLGLETIEEALDASVYLTWLLNNRLEKAYANVVAEAEAEVMRAEWD